MHSRNTLWRRGLTLPTLTALAAACLALGACRQVELLELLPLDDAGSAPRVPQPDAGTPLEVVLQNDIDLSRNSITGRTCAAGDLTSSVVVELATEGAELATAPTTDCLHAGDEVLVIWLQGSANDHADVGRFEFHELLAVEGSSVKWLPSAGALTRARAMLDEQHVVLQRVPRVQTLLVDSGAVLRAAAWDGQTGGVLALRVTGELRVEGTITMAGGGFRGGQTTAAAQAPGQQGESIAGAGAFATTANLGGGGGGIADQTTAGCQQDGNPGGGGGHAALGSDAVVQDLCDSVGRGMGGESYALSGRIFLGSGGGSAGTDNVLRDNPPGGAGGPGGGALFIEAARVLGSGAISADGSAGVGDATGIECLGGSTVDCFDHTGPGGGGAGGSIVLKAQTLELSELSTRGGKGGNGNDAVAGNGGDGSAGVTRLEH